MKFSKPGFLRDIFGASFVPSDPRWTRPLANQASSKQITTMDPTVEIRSWTKERTATAASLRNVIKLTRAAWQKIKRQAFWGAHLERASSAGRNEKML